MKQIWIDGHVGLGDQIYMRPFILELSKSADVWLSTAWPEMYWDVDHIHFVACDHGLRTQRENIGFANCTWEKPPRSAIRQKLFYTRDLVDRDIPIMQSLERQTEQKAELSLPIKPSWLAAANQFIEHLNPKKPLALVHPPTIRLEWAAPSRNPKPEYIEELTTSSKSRFHWHAISYLSAGAEHPVSDKGAWHSQTIFGELHWTTIAALMTLASVSVSAVGFFLPLAAAIKAKAFFVFGGHVKPELLISETMRRFCHYVAPEPFCNCKDRLHACNKTIQQERLHAAFETCVSSKLGLVSC